MPHPRDAACRRTFLVIPTARAARPGAALMSAGARLPGTPEPMHRWPGADGVVLAGDAWGDPQGPLVLLLHGGGQTRHAWGGTGRALGEAGYHAVACDARGHGDSGWAADGDYGPDALVRDLRATLAAWGGRPAALVGASLGGVTSLVAVGEAGLDAAALILVDIVPATEPAGTGRVAAFMGQAPDGFASLDEVAEAIARYRPQSRRSAPPRGLVKNVRLGADGRYRWHWDPRFLAVPRDTQQRRERLSACAARLRLPTLLVRGAGSDVVSDAGVQAFVGLCPHAEVVEVARAGHMVAGDRNDVFGRAALGFLSRVLPARAAERGA